MSHVDDIRELIDNHARRLQKLKEKRALLGFSTTPEIILEIEDIETVIENLRLELRDAEINSPNDNAKLKDVPEKSQRATRKSRPMSGMKGESYKGQGDNFNVTIGNYASEIAIGKNIQQIKISHQAQVEITKEDLAEVNHLFAGLRKVIVTDASQEKREAALERIDELEQSILAQVPDLTVMEYVKKWFVKNLPQLAGRITEILVHPIVGKIVEAAGELTADELKQRFGNSSE